MRVTPTAEFQYNLEQFRHLLFHLQMQCGSVHDIFRFFNEAEHFKHFEALKDLDPNLMPQLLAREYVLEAQQAETTVNAEKFLKTALNLDPACEEAFLELAALAQTAESSMMWYHKCLEATRTRLGESRFQELITSFARKPWQQVELHHFMKAKASLAELLFRNGYYENAILHLEELISWNRKDEVGFRHYLIIAYLCSDNIPKAVELKTQYPNDYSPQWYYARAFLQFKREGDTRRTQRLLLHAFRRNLWVPVYALGLENMPDMPDSASCQQNIHTVVKQHLSAILDPKQPFREGGRMEAVECVRCVAPAFYEDDNLTNWVWERLKMVND